MRIRKIDTDNQHDVRKFIHFPIKLYKNNPYFCPVLESQARFDLNRLKHPFYKHSTADFFLAESEGQVLGRIAAVHNTLHNQYRNVKTAFFWCFDVVDDFSVAESMFKAVFDWARGRERDTILGPRGLVGSDASGVLVDGFDQHTAMGIPYNFPYYDPFIQKMGFIKITDHLSGIVTKEITFPPRILEIAEKIKTRRGFQVKSFSSKKEMKQWAPRVLAVHEKAFAGTHEWHPSPAEELEIVVNSLIDIADPSLIKLVLKGDEVIGFALVYPDLSDALRRQKGRTHLMATFDLMREYKRTKWLVANGVGILPEFQKLGGNAVLYAELCKTIIEKSQYEFIDMVQVNETNLPSRYDMESIGVKWVKKHRSYHRNL
jgi:hypothetical protein